MNKQLSSKEDIIFRKVRFHYTKDGFALGVCDKKSRKQHFLSLTAINKSDMGEQKCFIVTKSILVNLQGRLCTVEMTTETAGMINDSPMLCGFPGLQLIEKSDKTQED